MATDTLLPEPINFFRSEELSIPTNNPTITATTPATPTAPGTTAQPTWLTDLENNGYAIVKNAIPHSRAMDYQQKALQWLTSFNTALDLSDRSTWVEANLPLTNSTHSIYRLYAVSHEKFVWDIRTEPGVVAAFATLWGTDQLLVSFDAINLMLPNRPDRIVASGWQHVDQSPFRKGRCCVQGIVALSHSGPNDGGLVVYPGSHKLTEEFFETQVDKKTWSDKDFFTYTREHIEWFEARGCLATKPDIEPGDLILWDSRTMHYGSELEPSSQTIRAVSYVTYTPARYAKPEALELKKEIFGKWGTTTHWPHDNIVLMDERPTFPDGTKDPRDRTEPMEKPELTEQILKLAGIIPY